MIVRLTLDAEARREMAPGELIVLGSDTGAEHPETYDQVEWLRDFCGKHGIEFVFITADMGYHSPAWLSLETQWQRNDSVGSAKGFKRSCTDNLKLIPLYAWIEDNVPRRYGIHVCGQKRATKEFAYRQGVSDVLIGFTIGEESRCASPADLANDHEFMRVAFRRRYPLIEWGWTRTDCQKYLRSVDAPVPPPSACIYCHFKSPLDILWTYRFFPAHYEKWVVYEARKVAKWKNRRGPNHGVFGAKLLPEILADATAAYGHLTDDELRAHRMTHAPCIPNRY